jgi:hypothetical protein
MAMFMWKNKIDNYYDFNLNINDVYNSYDPIELFQIKNHRNKNINVIIIYEIKKDIKSKKERFLGKIKSKHPWDSIKIEVGSYAQVISGDDLFLLKWDCVTKASEVGWNMEDGFLTFIKGD